jgi:hypothetical protein
MPKPDSAGIIRPARADIFIEPSQKKAIQAPFRSGIIRKGRPDGAGIFVGCGNYKYVAPAELSGGPNMSKNNPKTFGAGERIRPPCEDFSRGSENFLVRHYPYLIDSDGHFFIDSA